MICNLCLSKLLASCIAQGWWICLFNKMKGEKMVRPSYSQHVTDWTALEAPPWTHVLTVMLRQVPFRCSTPWPTSQWPPGQNDSPSLHIKNMGTSKGPTSRTGPPGHMMHPATFAQDLKNGRSCCYEANGFGFNRLPMNVEWSACYEWSLQNGKALRISQLHASSCRRNHKQSHVPLGYLPVGDSCLQLRSRINTNREGRQ